MDPNPYPVCPERLDPDPDCPERLDPDPNPVCPERFVRIRSISDRIRNPGCAYQNKYIDKKH